MATIQKFEDLIGWQKAQYLKITVYSLFRNCRDYSFKDQIQRASISIMNNIAEGYERRGQKEFKRFLYISKGSCAEVRSMLSLASKLTYISDINQQELLQLTNEISRILGGLIKKIN